MPRISKAMGNLLADLMHKIFEYSSQLHPENTFREQRTIERRINKHLETIVEYLAVIHEEEPNLEEEGKDVNS